jgi:hypothetical protein
MSVYQTNLWVCEVCGKHSVAANEVSPYSDPVVFPPEGEKWDYVGEPLHEKLACPECVDRVNCKPLT